jgi:branched-chain amino acid transport system substrate-binding protein
MLTRRSAFKAAAGVAAVATIGVSEGAHAADKVVHIGFDASYTGAAATDAVRITNGAILAFEEANKQKAVKGITFQLDKYDDGTATAGQYDPAQAAINARKMVADKDMLAALGPMMSGAGKAMSPILSAGDLAIITPSSTNPDITDPKFAAQYRPAGKAVYFRTVTTDAFQGPNMANYAKQALNVKSVFVLDDTGAFGVGVADAFQGQAEKVGIKVLGRDKLDPMANDYSAILTKVKSLNPDAIYFGGVTLAGVKLAKQAYEIIPKVIKLGPDGMFSADLLKGAGFPAVDGWYATNASPHLTDDPKLADWNKRFRARFNDSADDYTICAYDASWVIINAVKSLVEKGKPVTRSAVRDAIQATKMTSLQGPIEFDANGDIKNRVVSVFQIKKNDAKPLDDPQEQYKYIGVAPMA